MEVWYSDNNTLLKCIANHVSMTELDFDLDFSIGWATDSILRHNVNKKTKILVEAKLLIS